MRRGIGLGLVEEVPKPKAEAVNANEGTVLPGGDGPEGALLVPTDINERGILSELADRELKGLCR